MHLKKIFVFVLLIISSSLSFAVEPKAEDIVGFWLSEEQDGVVHITKSGDEFVGKLVWIKDVYEGKVKVELDDKNPDDKLKNRSLMNVQMLHGFKFKENEWSDGKIYDPNSGKTYSSFMKLENSNLLKLRGYVGISLFGRTSEWTRQKSSVPDKYTNKTDSNKNQ